MLCLFVFISWITTHTRVDDGSIYRLYTYEYKLYYPMLTESHHNTDILLEKIRRFHKYVHKK